MTKYEIIYEELQSRVDKGELTVEQAEVLNDLAYDKYATESADNTKDLELIDQLRGLVEAGKIKLSKDDIKCIKELIEDAEEDDDDKDDEKDESDDDKESDKKEEKSKEEEQATEPEENKEEVSEK